MGRISISIERQQWEAEKQVDNGSHVCYMHLSYRQTRSKTALSVVEILACDNTGLISDRAGNSTSWPAVHHRMLFQRQREMPGYLCLPFPLQLFGPLGAGSLSSWTQLYFPC